MIESNSDHAQFKPAVNRTVICFGAKYKNPLAIVLAVVQLIGSLVFELNFAHGIEVGEIERDKSGAHAVTASLALKGAGFALTGAGAALQAGYDAERRTL